MRVKAKSSKKNPTERGSTVNLATRNKNEDQHARSLRMENGLTRVTLKLLKRLNLFRNLSEQEPRVFSCEKEFFLVEPRK